MGKSKKEVFSTIRQRGWKKISGWKGKLLSRAGKEVLIKAVAQACTSYAMSVFKLPDYVVKDLTSMLSRFWWSANENSKGVSWVSWNTLCRPKTVGGLGFRDLKCFNMR